MSYTASATIARIKSKGFVSGASSLTDPELLTWLDDSLRSYIVPFLKRVRDEWFVSGTEDITPDSSARIPMPDSVGSTIRTIWWMNNGQPTPLVRIEPENAYMYQGQNGSSIPYGYQLKGYYLQILPTNVGSITVRIDFMERPPTMVLEEDAAEVQFAAGPVLNLSSVPLAWQSVAPNSVDIISGESPFMTIGTFSVVSLVGFNLTLSTTPTMPTGTSITDCWVSDAGTSPFPGIPIELHPLLQRSTITEYYAGVGDKRLEGSVKLQVKLENELRATLAPRTQGSARPIVNRSGPGMRGYSGRWGW